MNTVVFLALLVLSVEAKDFIVGTKENGELISAERVKLSAIPFYKRDQQYSYADPKQRTIKGIVARDLDKSEAEVKVVSGGVGSSYVTLHIEGQRGSKINYNIMIFSDKMCKNDLLQKLNPFSSC